MVIPEDDAELRAKSMLRYPTRPPRLPRVAEELAKLCKLAETSTFAAQARSVIEHEGGPNIEILLIILNSGIEQIERQSKTLKDFSSKLTWPPVLYPVEPKK